MEKVIYEQLCVLNLCVEDLSNDMKSRIKGKRNPFESWRIQVIADDESIPKILPQPSLIITYPPSVYIPPFKKIFPLIAADPKSMLVFASYTKEGIKNQINDLNPKPKCIIFNLKKEYESYEFQNHADKPQIDQLRTELKIKKEVLFHLKEEFKTFKKLFP